MKKEKYLLKIISQDDEYLYDKEEGRFTKEWDNVFMSKEEAELLFQTFLKKKIIPADKSLTEKLVNIPDGLFLVIQKYGGEDYVNGIHIYT